MERSETDFVCVRVRASRSIMDERSNRCSQENLWHDLLVVSPGKSWCQSKVPVTVQSTSEFSLLKLECMQGNSLLQLLDLLAEYSYVVVERY